MSHDKRPEENQEHPGWWNDSGMAPGEWFKHRHLVEQIGRCYDLHPGDRDKMIQAHELFLQLERERKAVSEFHDIDMTHPSKDLALLERVRAARQEHERLTTKMSYKDLPDNFVKLRQDAWSKLLKLRDELELDTKEREER